MNIIHIYSNIYKCKSIDDSSIAYCCYFITTSVVVFDPSPYHTSTMKYTHESDT